MPPLALVPGFFISGVSFGHLGWVSEWGQNFLKMDGGGGNPLFHVLPCEFRLVPKKRFPKEANNYGNPCRRSH